MKNGSGVDLHILASKAELEVLSLGRKDLSSACAQQRLALRIACRRDRPPGIHLLQKRQVCPANHHRRARWPLSNRIRYRNYLAPAPKHVPDGCQLAAVQRSLRRGHDRVRAKTTEFAVELGSHIGIHAERHRCHGCHHGDREQRGQGAVFAHPCGFHQKQKNQLGAAHASPRSTTAGSKRMALRIAPVLPANVITRAPNSTMASTTGDTVMDEPKTLSPMRWARTTPAANPRIPPPMARIPASVRNNDATAILPAPRDFINPTSCRRSMMVAAITAETASAEATSEALVS